MQASSSACRGSGSKTGLREQRSDTSPRPVFVEEVVHELRGRGVEARRLLEVRQARFGDVFGRAESEQERTLARRADARDLVERAFHEFLLAPSPGGPDGKAMRLVAQALDKEERRVARAQLERLASLDEEGLAAGVAGRALGG